MRDIIFLPVFVFCLAYIFKRPIVGVCLWVWVALLTPNFLLWGFASSIRYNFVISILTLAIILFTHFKPSRLNNKVFYFALLFLIWTMVSSANALGDPDIVSRSLEKLIKVFLLFSAILLAATERRHLMGVMAAATLGLGYYIIAESAKVVLSGGSHRVWGPGTSIIGDNNHFALAVLVTIPFALFLYRNAEFSKYIRWGLFAFIFMCIAVVFGTYSRGGLIGLIIFAILYSIIFKKKALVGSAFLVITLVFASYVPTKWTDRMDTIKTADQDNSFMGRVIAWKQSTLVALDHPYVGGGFKVIEYYPVWMTYADKFHRLNFIPTGYPDPIRAHAAHSIYFQVLGEHGFVGLALFGFLVLFALRNARKCRKMAKQLNKHGRWHKELAESLLISICVYLVVGAALNMAYFDMLYVLLALTQVQRAIIESKEELKPQTKYSRRAYAN